MTACCGQSFDGGYERGGSIDRAGGEFSIYFPCAYAIRGQCTMCLGDACRARTSCSMELGTPKKHLDGAIAPFPSRVR